MTPRRIVHGEFNFEVEDREGGHYAVACDRTRPFVSDEHRMSGTAEFGPRPSPRSCVDAAKSAIDERAIQ